MPVAERLWASNIEGTALHALLLLGSYILHQWLKEAANPPDALVSEHSEGFLGTRPHAITPASQLRHFPKRAFWLEFGGADCTFCSDCFVESRTAATLKEGLSRIGHWPCHPEWLR